MSGLGGAKTLQEYLVSLGVKLDEKNMTKMDGFLKSAKIGFTALAGITLAATTAATKWIKEMNQTEIALQKQAKAQHKSIESVRASENALKALGRTKQDIAKDKSLKAIYDDLVKMNKAMALPDGSRGLSLVKSIASEFYKFKSTIQYAMQWVNYHIITKLEGPLTRIRDTMQKWREKLTAEMPLWTAKIANGLSVFVRLLETGIRAGGELIQFIQNLPEEIKIMGTAVLGLWSIIRAGPLGWLLGGLTMLLLLLDDFYAYQRGEKSALSGLWEGLDDGSIGGKLSTALENGINEVTKWIDQNQGTIGKIGSSIGNIIAGAMNLAGILAHALMSDEVLSIAYQLGGAIIEGLTSGLEGVFDSIVDEFFKSWSDFMSELPDWAKKLLGIYEDDEDKMISADMANNGRLFDENGDILSVEDSRKIFKEDPEKYRGLQSKEKTVIYETQQKIRVDSGMTELPTGMMAWSKEYPTYMKLLDRFNAATGEEEMKTIAGTTKHFKEFWDGGMDRDEILKYAEAALEKINKDFPPPFSKGQTTTDSGHGGSAKGFGGSVDSQLQYDSTQVIEETQDAVDVAQGAVNPIYVPLIPEYGADGDVEVRYDPDRGTKRNALGGRYDKPVASTLAEDGDAEYVIPIKKLGRAIPLIRMMLAEMGDKARGALVGFGVGPDTDLNQLVESKGLGMPGGGSPIINVVNNNTVHAPATIIVNGAGQDPQAVGQATYNAQERFLVRTLKGAIQSE